MLNTIPTFRPTNSISLISAVSVMPTILSPFDVRLLIHRIMVDLPEPEGPQITSFHPAHREIDITQNMEISIPFIHILKFNNAVFSIQFDIPS